LLSPQKGRNASFQCSNPKETEMKSTTKTYVIWTTVLVLVALAFVPFFY
jgi:hypothetical protein